MIDRYAFWRYLVWPPLAGIVFAAIGVICARRAGAFKRDGLMALGSIFVPAALAAFAAEHMTSAKNLKEIVPPWMPARLLWTYFVGFALFAAAASIAARKYVRWSAGLLGLMFFLFVVLIHVPGVVAHPSDRFRWAVALRDSSFALGAFALAATQLDEGSGRRALVVICRLGIGSVLVFYSAEHFLHPRYLPGVPLEQLTPAWFPVPALWGILMGAAELAAGVLLLMGRCARSGAIWAAMTATGIVALIYFPMLAVARTPMDVTVGVNYIFDTLLFAGCLLLLAQAVEESRVA